MLKVGIIGVTGYAGQQLLWILEKHPEVEIQLLSSRSYDGMDISNVYPNFQDRFNKSLFSEAEFVNNLDSIDILFMALPHGLSQSLAQEANKKQIKVIDLGADFRFDDVEEYEKWYSASHSAKWLNKEMIYGLTELYRNKLKHADLVASPGCFPTSAILGAAPLLKAKLVNSKSIIIDSKSGTTGAGRSTKTTSLFCEVNESFKAYGIFSHRHRPEIEQELSKIANEKVEVVFTPHLLPINRGIFSTIYFDLLEDKTEAELYQLYQDFYQDDYFIRIRKELPEISHVKNSNICDIAIRVDQERRKVVVTTVIDNLIKGAAGQAVQSMNVMCDFDERLGLDFLSMYI